MVINHFLTIHSEYRANQFSVAIDNVMTNALSTNADSFGFTGFAGLSSPSLVSGFVGGLNTLEFGTENQGAGPGAVRR
jgi:hypothetical protein